MVNFSKLRMKHSVNLAILFSHFRAKQTDFCIKDRKKYLGSDFMQEKYNGKIIFDVVREIVLKLNCEEQTNIKIGRALISNFLFFCT